VSDTEIRGFILTRATSYDAEILTLAIEPIFRRQGLARMLTDAAAQLAATLGAESLFLEVAEDNPAAIALYANLGFVQVGRRRGYYARAGATPVDALVMRRDLNRRPT
jgi:ribosomal-protein-alanine N-acetyltransferase